MARFYGLAVNDTNVPPVGLTTFGERLPEGVRIPDRPSDFPPIHLPFAEAARISVINRLYAEWSAFKEQLVLIQVNDAGVAEAWYADVT